MNSSRFDALTGRYRALRLALVGDFCLDRYLEIDPARAETSLETGLSVHNVVGVRAQPGGTGTILNNLAALGVGELWPVGFCGDDGEGYELRRALATLPGVRLDHFQTAPDRRTFTYCKPLILEAGKPPRELNRLDSKNWSATPPAISEALAASIQTLSDRVDGVIVLDQVDVADTGVVTPGVLAQIHVLAGRCPQLPILADSRRGLRGWPPVILTMNLTELLHLSPEANANGIPGVQRAASALARGNGRSVFVTLAERGLVGADPDGACEHVEALPLRGAIDIVGAGDAVMANLACAQAAGATLRQSLELAGAAASIVIHQLGTTGTATVAEMRARLCS